MRRAKHSMSINLHASLSWQAVFTWAADKCDHLEYETTLGESYEINQESTRKHKATSCCDTCNVIRQGIDNF